MLCLTNLIKSRPIATNFLRGSSTRYPVNQQVLEFCNWTTYGMNHTSRFNKSWYFYFLEMFQLIEKYFCVSNQKIRSFNFKVYYNRFLYFHTFLRKTPWKLFDPFIKFRLQMWRMNYLHISKSFSVFLWNIFENITGMPLRGHLLAARILMLLFSLN